MRNEAWTRLLAIVVIGGAMVLGCLWGTAEAEAATLHNWWRGQVEVRNDAGTMAGVIISGVTGGIEATGELIIQGNSTLGNAAADTLTINAVVASNVIPDGSNTRDLGSGSAYWDDLYIDDLFTSGSATFDIYVSNGASTLSILNSGISGGAQVCNGSIDGSFATGTTLTVGTDLTVSGGDVVGVGGVSLDLGEAAAGGGIFTGSSGFMPNTNGTTPLGAITAAWGTVYGTDFYVAGGDLIGIGSTVMMDLGEELANQLQVTALSGLVPSADNTSAIGVAGKAWAAATIYDVNVSDDLTVTDTTNLNGAVNIGDAAGDALTIKPTTWTLSDTATLDVYVAGANSSLYILNSGTSGGTRTCNVAFDGILYSGGQGKWYGDANNCWLTVQSGNAGVLVNAGGSGDVSINYNSGDDFLVYGGDAVVDFSVTNTGDISNTGNSNLGDAAGDITTVKGFIGLSAATAYTIASDAITITASYGTLSGQGGVADNLSTINGGVAGYVVVLKMAGAGTITVKNNVGNILCGADQTLDNQADRITLQYDGDLSKWVMLAFSGNA